MEFISTKVYFNWVQSGDKDGYGEDYHVAEIGKHYTGRMVTYISHPSSHCIIIRFEDGSEMVNFNPNSVFYAPEPNG
jgi:hypothetical protein